MAAEICRGCDYYKPKDYRLIGRECAPFITCTENDWCGTRIPPLPKDYPGRFAPVHDPSKNKETQAIAEVEEHGYAHGD